jgi:hypothetical protein
VYRENFLWFTPIRASECFEMFYDLFYPHPLLKYVSFTYPLCIFVQYIYIHGTECCIMEMSTLCKGIQNSACKITLNVGRHTYTHVHPAKLCFCVLLLHLLFHTVDNSLPQNFVNIAVSIVFHFIMAPIFINIFLNKYIYIYNFRMILTIVY